MGKLDYSKQVSPLINLGVPEDPWPDYLTQFGLTRENIPELIRMAVDEDIWSEDDEDPAVYRCIHAWRALGQLRAVEAIPHLLSVLRWGDEHDDDWASVDLPQALAMIGPKAIPLLTAYLADSQHSKYTRASAADALVEIPKAFPEARETCVVAIRATLENYPENDAILNGYLVADLAEMRAVDAAPLVEQAFQAGRVDEIVMGDWEDFQVEVGLLKERITPHKYQRNLVDANRWPSMTGQQKVKKEDKKTKNKRKQEKQSRKKNRKKKR